MVEKSSKAALAPRALFKTNLPSERVERKTQPQTTPKRHDLAAQVATMGADSLLPPATAKRIRRDGASTLIAFRIQNELLAKIDSIRGDGTRQEAIRTILERELSK